MSRQRTIEKEVEFSGRGLFTGYPVTVRFKPAPAGNGVTFVRIDQDKPIRVAAHIDNLPVGTLHFAATARFDRDGGALPLCSAAWRLITLILN